jgi:hypothetical protein
VSAVGLGSQCFGEGVKLVIGHAAPSPYRMWRLMLTSDGLQPWGALARVPPFDRERLGGCGGDGWNQPGRAVARPEWEQGWPSPARRRFTQARPNREPT